MTNLVIEDYDLLMDKWQPFVRRSLDEFIAGKPIKFYIEEWDNNFPPRAIEIVYYNEEIYLQCASYKQLQECRRKAGNNIIEKIIVKDLYEVQQVIDRFKTDRRLMAKMILDNFENDERYPDLFKLLI